MHSWKNKEEKHWLLRSAIEGTGLPWWLNGKEPPAKARDAGDILHPDLPSLDREDPLEKEMASHSSILSWRITWTEETDRLQPMGSQRVGYDLAPEHMHMHLEDTRCTSQGEVSREERRLERLGNNSNSFG